MLDALHVRACNAYSKLDLPETPLLLVEFHGTPETVKDDTARFTDICCDHSHSPFNWSSDPDERKLLWKARHDALWAATHLSQAQRALPLMFAFQFQCWQIAWKKQSPASTRPVWLRQLLVTLGWYSSRSSNRIAR